MTDASVPSTAIWPQNLLSQPDGVIHDKTSAAGRSVIEKHGSEIQWYYAHPYTDPPVASSGFMSRVDLHDPLNLLSLYSQFAMLSLLWQDNPGRMYTLGFGGGRIPSVLHHYFPECAFESSEIDPNVPDIARQFFGISFDGRMGMDMTDGRTHLETMKTDVQYDMLFADAFDEHGRTDRHIFDQAFMSTCLKHLSRNGVFCVNVLGSESSRRALLILMHGVFPHMYIASSGQVAVLFGVPHTCTNREEINKQAQTLEEKHQFHFPFVDNVAFMETAQTYLSRATEI